MAEQADEFQEKAYFSAKLRATLKLDGEPVAVAVVPEVPQAFQKWRRKATLCVMLQRARRGLSFYCSADGVICGGRVHIGIGQPPIWNLENFLVKTEKIVVSKTAARKMLDSAKEQAPALGKYVIVSPLSQASFHPDVVVFIGTPLQVSRILFLDAFKTGEISTRHREPLCAGVIATPITTREIGLSFLDMACRSFGRYRPEEMAIGVPYCRVPGIVDSIDQSIAGTNKPSLALRLLAKMMNSDRD